MVTESKSAEEIFNERWPEMESSIQTMAKKVFLPGYELDDIMQVFRLEAYKAAEYWDPQKADYPTLVWTRCYHARDNLIQKYNSQKRDFTKESFSPGNEIEDWNSDEYSSITQEHIGNANKYCQILMMETVDQIGKAILVLQAGGYNINDTVDIIRKNIDPDFDRRDFEKKRWALRENEELKELTRNAS